MNPISVASPGFDDDPDNVLLFLEYLTTGTARRSVNVRATAIHRSLDPAPTGEAAVDRRIRNAYELVSAGNIRSSISSSLSGFLDTRVMQHFRTMQRSNWATASRRGGRTRRDIFRDQLQQITTLPNKADISILGSFLFGFRESGPRLYQNDTTLHRVMRSGGVNHHRGGRENPADGPRRLPVSFTGILDTFWQGGLDNLYANHRNISDNGLMPTDVVTHRGIHNGDPNPEVSGATIQSAAIPYEKIFLAYAGYVGYSYWRFANELAVSNGTPIAHHDFNFSSTDVDALDRISMNMWIAFSFAAQAGPHWKNDPRSSVTAYADRPQPLNDSQKQQELRRRLLADPTVVGHIRRLGATRVEDLRSDSAAWRDVTRIGLTIRADIAQQNKFCLQYGTVTLLDYVRDNVDTGITLNDIKSILTFRDTSGHQRDFISGTRRLIAGMRMGIALTAIEEEQIAWATSRASSPTPTP